MVDPEPNRKDERSRTTRPLLNAMPMPRRPPVTRRHVLSSPARLQPAQALQPVEALEHGAAAQPGVDREGAPVPVVARKVGHEGGEDLERGEGDALRAVVRGHGREPTSNSGW